MACECLTKDEERILNHLKLQNPDKKITSGSFENQTFLYAATPPRTQLYFEFGFQYHSIKKDGSLGIERNGQVSMIPTYCGFCGKKYDEI